MSVQESTTVAPDDAPIRVRDKKRVLTSAFVGTTIEWYDFYLYGTAAALIFGSQYFPAASDFAGTMAAFATFAVGFIARPLGGIIAGHLGDRIGRKALLVASLITMGVASTGIGLLPNFESIGALAVIGLVTLRLLQGLACGAEWGGSALLSVEHAPRHLRGFFGSFTQIGSAAGMLLATSAFFIVQSLTTSEQFQAYGWRIPFLASAVLVIVGLYIRVGVDDAPNFKRLKKEEKTAKAPVWEVLRNHKRGLLITMGMRMAQPALFYLLTVYIIGYIQNRRGEETIGVTAVMIGSAIGLASGPLWGWASDRWGRRPISFAAIVGIAVFIWPFFWYLDNGALILLPLVMIFAMNVLHDSIYGSQAAWFAEQFPVHLRYTGVSLGYQIGTVLSGGLTPMIAAALLNYGGNEPWLICAYITVLCGLSLVSAVAAKDPTSDAIKSGDGAKPADTFEEIS